MLNMKDIDPRSLVISTLLGATLIFSAGCGGDSGGNKSSVDPTAAAASAGEADDATAVAEQDAVAAADAAKTYTGDRTLTGTVDTSTLASSDRTLVTAHARPGGRSVTATTTAAVGSEIVKLYVVDSEGALKDTGITCTVTSGSYSCPNIEGGIDYVVRYVKQLDNGKVLEMRSTATVPTDTDPDPVKIDPITTMVAEAVVQAVTEAITGLISNEDLVQSIIASVKTAVTQTMTTLIKTGAITIPSMVEDGDLDTIQNEATQKENLADATGAVLTDDTVNEALTATKTDALAATVATMSKRQRIEAIFTQMMKGDGGGAPKWLVNFIGDSWDKVTSTMTFAWLEEQAIDAMAVSSDEYVTYELEKLGVTDVQVFLTALQAAVNAGITDGTAFTGAMSEIANYHTIKAIPAADRTEEQKAYLGEFPAIVGELFPADFVATATESTQIQNSGQLTAYLIYLIDIYVNDATADYIDAQQLDVFGDQARNMHLIDFEDPSFLLEGLGFNATVANAYAGIYFDGWAEVQTRKIWSTDGTNQQVLSIYTSVENPTWFFNAITADEVTSATLTYPTATGTTTVDLTVELDDDTVQLSLEGATCDETGCSVNEGAVTDHVTGDYTISVTARGVTATKTFENVLVISEPDNYSPKLTSPREYPKWNDDMTSEEYNTLWTAFQNAGGISVLRPNTDTDGNDVNDSLQGAVFKWTAPDVSDLNLPDGVKVGYQINISRYKTSSITEQDNCNQGNWEDCNTEIYSTWWDDRIITGTSFTLPVALPENDPSDESNGIRDEYSIGVHMMLIEKATGREIAQGGETWANFRVGQPPYTLNGTEPINFAGDISGTLPDNAVVALLAESNSYDDETGDWTWTTEVIAYDDTVTSGSYELNTTTGTIKNKMGEGKWFSIILFSDTDGDQTWDPWTPDAQGEDGWWMQNHWFWFETWGDFRVSQDDPSGNFSSSTVNDASGATLTGMDITVE